MKRTLYWSIALALVLGAALWLPACGGDDSGDSGGVLILGPMGGSEMGAGQGGNHGSNGPVGGQEHGPDDHRREERPSGGSGGLDTQVNMGLQLSVEREEAVGSGSIGRGQRFSATVTRDDGATPNGLSGAVLVFDRDSGEVIEQPVATFQQEGALWIAEVFMRDVHAVQSMQNENSVQLTLVFAFADADGNSASLRRAGHAFGCPPGIDSQLFCDNGCYNTYVDTNNCGACGNRCGAGARCERGVCACGQRGMTDCFQRNAATTCTEYCARRGRSCVPECTSVGSGGAGTRPVAVQGCGERQNTRPLYSGWYAESACDLPLSNYPNCVQRCTLYKRAAAAGTDCTGDCLQDRIDECPNECARSTRQPTQFSCCCGFPPDGGVDGPISCGG